MVPADTSKAPCVARSPAVAAARDWAAESATRRVGWNRSGGGEVALLENFLGVARLEHQRRRVLAARQRSDFAAVDRRVSLGHRNVDGAARTRDAADEVAHRVGIGLFGLDGDRTRPARLHAHREHPRIALTHRPVRELRPEFDVAVPSNPAQRRQRVGIAGENRRAAEPILPRRHQRRGFVGARNLHGDLRAVLGFGRSKKIDRRNVVDADAGSASRVLRPLRPSCDRICAGSSPGA